jgi:hypothetical protein
MWSRWFHSSVQHDVVPPVDDRVVGSNDGGNDGEAVVWAEAGEGVVVVAEVEGMITDGEMLTCRNKARAE